MRKFLRIANACLAILFLLSLPMSRAVWARNNNSNAAMNGARQAVDALNREEVASCMKMDHAASASLWADDGVDLIQGLAPIIGKAAIAKWYDSLIPQLRGAKMEYCTIDWREIKIQGDWAWEWGINRQKISFPPPQKPFESEGKILLILKQQASGQWKIELESWNSNPQAREQK